MSNENNGLNKHKVLSKWLEVFRLFLYPDVPTGQKGNIRIRRTQGFDILMLILKLMSGRRSPLAHNVSCLCLCLWAPGFSDLSWTVLRNACFDYNCNWLISSRIQSYRYDFLTKFNADSIHFSSCPPAILFDPSPRSTYFSQYCGLINKRGTWSWRTDFFPQFLPLLPFSLVPVFLWKDVDVGTIQISRLFERTALKWRMAKMYDLLISFHFAICIL